MVVRPLRATDVELDYDAVTSSAERLRRWSQTEWPADDFTLAENLDDLRRHEREHLERAAFTFTVLDRQETACLGCVYFTPLGPEAAHLCEGAGHAAAIGFWVRTSELAGDLDQHLLFTLREWIEAAWAFDCVAFAISPLEERQAALFAHAGLVRRSIIALPDGRERWVFQ